MGLLIGGIYPSVTNPRLKPIRNCDVSETSTRASVTNPRLKPIRNSAVAVNASEAV